MDWLHRTWQRHGGRVKSLGCLALVWQLTSFYLPAYLVPGLQQILREFALIFVTPELLGHLAATVGRLLLGLTVAFIVGALLACGMSLSQWIERHMMPLVEVLMGIPALALVVLIIIWVPYVELRVFVVLLLVCFPFFTVQILDGIRGVPKELIEMLRIFRPNRLQLFAKLIMPGVIPAILTSWKLTTAYGTRAVIIAELVGATRGVGNRLLTAQESFEMDDAMAWTLVLVAFLGLAQLLIASAEKYLLRWRPQTLIAAGERAGDV